MSTDSITVYCTQGNVIFNSNKDLKLDSKKKTFKLKKFIVNPIFHTMREFNKDPFWDIFLMKGSRDNFPKGFSFRDNVIFYSLKTKYNFELKLDENNLEASFFELKTFVSDKGILSDKDKETMVLKHEEDRINNDIEIIESWKDLGKLQNNCIYSYISTLTSLYNLNMKERKNLESLLKIGISSGYLNDKNIFVENSCIQKIIPIIWNENERNFSLDTRNIRIKKTRVTKQSNIDLSTDNTTTCLDFEKKYNISNINKKWEKLLSSIYKA